MATLTINANDVDSTSVQVRYRILNSGATYTVITLDPSQLPYAIAGLQNAQYEVGVKNFCNNGSSSDWVVSQSAPCALPTSFAAVKSGSNFAINYTLSGVQTKIFVQVTDPNGGVQTYSNDNGTQTGTFNIPITSGLTGVYSIAGSAQCDGTSIPVFQSTFTTPAVSVNVPAAPTSFNVKVGTDSSAICGSSALAIYSASTTIAPGAVMYYDSGLTLPVNDKTFITDASGNIYAINSSGIVGADTGLNC